MGRMAGPDPLFRLHWSKFTPLWVSTHGPKGKKETHPDVSPQIELDEGKHADTEQVFCAPLISVKRRPERFVAMLTKHIHQSI